MHGFDGEDTIVAPATSTTGGYLAIVRVAGPDALAVVQSCLVPPANIPSNARTIVATEIQLETWRRTASVDLYVWPDGRSYTGQPTIEIHLPACAPLQSAIVEACVSHGARLAQPGEFTLRAFLAGKLDLVQAEAVLALVEAQDERQLRAAIDQRAGGLSRAVHGVRDRLLDLLADLEAGLDFAADDVVIVSARDLRDRLAEIRDDLELLASQLACRRVDDDLPTVVLVGKPNAGKSSLFNVLVDSPSAIVSSKPGTTRDYVTADLRLGSLALRLVDTAGIETPAGDAIQAQASALRNEVLGSADLLLWCVSADAADKVDPPACRQWMRLRTRCDLVDGLVDPQAAVFTSALTGEGIDALRYQIVERLLHRPGPSSASIAPVTQRCLAGIIEARQRLADAWARTLAGEGHELIAPFLRDALHSLGEITGAVYTDDILDRVFSRFCIGK